MVPSGGQVPYAVTASAAGTPVTLDASFGGEVIAPTAIGTWPVAVSVSDTYTSIALSASVAVENVRPNRAPFFGSAPPALVGLNAPFEHAIDVTDPDGDALAFTLLGGPAGMTLGADGTLRWLPESVGEAEVRISVSDGLATLERTWTMTVVPTVPPSIASEPVPYARAGTEYRYVLSVSNADGLPLAFSMANGPSGAHRRRRGTAVDADRNRHPADRTHGRLRRGHPVPAMERRRSRGR